MKKIISLILILTFILITFNFAVCEELNTSTKISVSATSVINIKPDSAKLIIGVTSNNKIVRTAQEETVNKINLIIPAILKLGVNESDVKTSNFDISPVYDYSSSSYGNNTIQSYNVNYSLEVTINDTNIIGSIIDESIKNGANSSFNLQFLNKNNDNAYLEALKNAVEIAKQKAEILASASGLKITKILSIDENLSNNYYMYSKSFSRDEVMDSAIATPILSGELSVSASINMVFEAK